MKKEKIIKAESMEENYTHQWSMTTLNSLAIILKSLNVSLGLNEDMCIRQERLVGIILLYGTLTVHSEAERVCMHAEPHCVYRQMTYPQ